jgi:hypothetical protein
MSSKMKLETEPGLNCRQVRVFVAAVRFASRCAYFPLAMLERCSVRGLRGHEVGERAVQSMRMRSGEDVFLDVDA